MNLEKICTKTIDITKSAGNFIRTEARKFSTDKVETKGLHNFVSYVDKSSEQQLVDALSSLLPEAGFITEEETRNHKGEQLKWVIDPLDGTTNFIHGLPAYSISIGLMDGDKSIMGVVYDINLDECFYAWKDGGAWLNGKPIKVSPASTVKDSLIGTGFPYYDFDKMKDYLASFEYLLKNSHGARRAGSAALDLAWVASGRFEAFYEYSLQPWDVVGGAFIVEQAGGKICDFNGGPNYIFGHELVATNGFIHDEFLGIVKKFMKSAFA